MIEVEVLGAPLAPAGPAPREVRRLCAMTAARMGVVQAHVAVEFVNAERIAQLNGEHRDRPVATDVLSFPIDGVDATPATDGTDARTTGPRPSLDVPVELGDVVICPEYTADVGEAIVHGMLHLLGMDHETDDGEMLALQRELLAGADG